MSRPSKGPNLSEWRKRRTPGAFSRCGCLAVAVLCVAVPAFGQAFTYSENFNAVPDGATPPGWVVNTCGNDPIPLAGANPRVMAADPAGWATAVDYSVAWSGGKRFTLFHPAWVPGGIWAGGATFTGAGATYSGSYPLHLQTDSLKAEFDLAYRTGDTAAVRHGCTFVVQPVQDAQHVRVVGRGYGRMGFDMNGFAIEFDTFQNTGAGGNGRGDPDGNHIGVDLYRLWDIQNTNDLGDGTTGNGIAGGITVPSLKTSVQQGVTDLPALYTVGDNNQPLHVTVFYNDPAQGGAGAVRVYVKVDPATYAGGGTAIAYAETENGGLGRLVVDTCVGTFPAANAVFGFTAGVSGSRHVSQVDNLQVATTAVGAGSACTVTYPDLSAVYLEGVPAFDAGTAVDLGGLGVTPLQPTAAGLTQPGWDVSTYWLPPLNTLTNQGYANYLELCKAAMAFQASKGFAPLAHVTGEPNINYWEAGTDGDGNIGDNRLVPGLVAGTHWYSILAKGYIYFPQAGDFSLCVNSDNGFELSIGGQVVNSSLNDGVFTTGLNGGSSVNVHVAQAGVYPIQLLYLERTGGAYVEFYRRTDQPMMPYLLVGNSDGGLADQPVVYGLRNSAAAPDAVATYTPMAEPRTANISPTQKINGVPAGNAVFKVKMMRGPIQYNIGAAGQYANIYYVTPAYTPAFNSNAYELLANVMLRWLDVLDNMPGAPTTTPVIDFHSSNDPDIWLPGGTLFPAGLEANPGSFGFRAEGYATFPAAGVYYLSLIANDTGYLRIGDQTICKVWDFNSADGATLIRVVINEAGTYPIRLEGGGGSTGGAANNFELLELNANGLVRVNGPGSSIVVHEAAQTAGGQPLAFKWEPRGHIIPAERKVANHGDGNTLGFATKMARTSLWWPAYASHGTALLEGDVYYKQYLKQQPVPAQVTPLPGDGAAAEAVGYDACTTFNYGPTEGGTTGRFGADRGLANFTDAYDPDNSGFAVSGTGYIDFPAPGDYAINLHIANGGQMWIGGLVVSWRPYITVTATAGIAGLLDNDSQHAIVHVDEAGIYDIRADFNYWKYRHFFPTTTAQDNAPALEIYQVLPDASQVLVNDPASTVKVYLDLKPGVVPAVTKYHNPTQVSASTKVAGAGRQRGMRLAIVNSANGFANPPINTANLNQGGWYGAVGYDEFATITAAEKLIAALVDGQTVLNGRQILDQTGNKSFDGIVQKVAFRAGGVAPWDTSFPTGTQTGWSGGRVTGLMDLKKGGHLFYLFCGDGMNFTLGDQNWRSGSYKNGNGDGGDFCYMYIPEDGLYPFTYEFTQFDGTQSFSLMELKILGSNAASPTATPTLYYEAINDPGTASYAASAVKVYLDACSLPFMDVAGGGTNGDQADGSIDQKDFGVFQACYTGAQLPPSLVGACNCLDRSTPADGLIDNNDLFMFLNCYTGPAIFWAPSVNCPQ